MPLPEPLTPGSTIGLVTPAGPVVNPQHIKEGLNILKNAGFRVKITASLDEQDHYLAGSDRERAEQFINVWLDSEVDGVLAVRGGYGSLRMLPYLDMEIIKQQPKAMFGFSDISILLNVICQEAEITTFHGPMLNTLSRSDEKSLDSFFNVLKGNYSGLKVPEIHPLKSGDASGQIIGGNLASLAHMIGTIYDFPWDGAILFIEDTGEALYRIDRLLTHLHAAGKLKKLSGLIVGSFTQNDGKEVEWKDRVWERIMELAGDYPVWADFPSGHGPTNLTIPVGLSASMNTSQKTLEFS